MNIEQQPRGLAIEELRLKVNEIVIKFNRQEERLAAIEQDRETRLIGAIEQAEATLGQAIEFFKARTGK